MSKTAFITGASKGIGMACAEKFYDMGYNIVAVYRCDDEGMQSFLHGRDEARIFVAKGDVSDYDAMQEAAASALKRFGSLDVLINNAGIAQQKMINDITPHDWDRMFDVNAKGVFNCVKACMDNMIHNKYGRIVNISSIWGVSGASCEVHYSASKAAVIGFTKALAKELGPSGITVNCVAPGVIDTPMNKALDDETVAELKDSTPLMRIGTAREIADAVAFFASESSSFITGQILTVDGGLIL